MERRTYFLDLPTLLTHLQHQIHIYILMTSLDNGKTGYVLMSDGKMTRCVVTQAKGMLSEGEQAYKTLLRATAWQVLTEQEAQHVLPLLTTSQPRHTQPSLPAIISPQRRGPVPIKKKREIAIDHLPLTVKQRIQLRMVFSMINGQRTAQQIKAQLQLPAEIIDEILHYLISLDAIE